MGMLQTVTAMRGCSGETSSTCTASSGPSGTGFPSSISPFTIMNDFIDFLECFLAGSSGRGPSNTFECRAVRKPRRLTVEVLVGFENDFEIIGFHCHYYIQHGLVLHSVYAWWEDPSNVKP